MKKILIIGAVLLLAFIYWDESTFLVAHGERVNDYTLNKELINKIENDTRGMYHAEIVDYSIEVTGQYLQFSEHNDIDAGKANCVGYAKLCASICNYAFKINGIDGYAKPVVGHIQSCGINLCSLAESIVPDQWKPFVKDHDFVEFDPYLDNNTVFADPCVHDVLGTDLMTYVTHMVKTTQ